MFFQGSRVVCKVCGCSVPVRKRRNLLYRPCKAAAAPAPGAPAAAAGPLVGLREVHPSHAAEYHPELRFHFCASCGAVAHDHLRALAEPCPPCAKRAGRDALARIRKGLLPGNSKRAIAFNRSKALFKGRADAHPSRKRKATALR